MGYIILELSGESLRIKQKTKINELIDTNKEKYNFVLILTR